MTVDASLAFRTAYTERTRESLKVNIPSLPFWTTHVSILKKKFEMSLYRLKLLSW